MPDTSNYSIFLSYRRSDSRGYTGWLHQLLAQRFPDDEVFRDIDGLHGGERWVDRLDDILARCNVMVAVIGPDWVSAANEKGRRLDDPGDRVRMELEAAIRRGVPLIPALVGGARMPDAEELPSSLVNLHEWQAVRLSDESWEHDVEQLVSAVEHAREAPPGELRAGDAFAGHRIEAQIGRGGMGVVYRARHVGLDRVDAIKVISPELAQAREFRQRFIREAQLAASLRHENVVTVHDAGEEGGQLYMTMQMVEGEDLAAVLQRSGPLQPAEAAELVAPLASALDAAHELGLVHRDVKPSNVLIEQRAEHRRRIYLGDFGLAQEQTTDTGLTSSGHWVGTADYVSPEQVMGEPVDGRADIYALGCVVFEMLAGRVPYPGHSETAKLVAHATKQPPALTEIRPDTPPAVAEVVSKAMARDPAERFQTATEFSDALAAAVAGEPVRAAAAPAPRARTQPAARDAEPSTAAGPPPAAEPSTAAEPSPAAPAPTAATPPATGTPPPPAGRSRRPLILAAGAVALVAVIAAVAVAASSGGRSHTATTVAHRTLGTHTSSAKAVSSTATTSSSGGGNSVFGPDDALLQALYDMQTPNGGDVSCPSGGDVSGAVMTEAFAKRTFGSDAACSSAVNAEHLPPALKESQDLITDPSTRVITHGGTATVILPDGAKFVMVKAPESSQGWLIDSATK
jgi:serine/threonine-protein kinase